MVDDKKSHEPRKVIRLDLDRPLTATERLARDIKNMDVMDSYARELRATEDIQREVEKLANLNKLVQEHDRIQKLLQPASHVHLLIEQERLARDERLRRQVEALASPLGSFQRLQLEQVEHALATSAGSVTSWLQREQQAQFDWAKRMADMVSPWARIQAEVQSARALSELNSVGAALRSFRPFEDSFTAALRVDFGDWRDSPEPGEQVYVDPVARRQFYVAQGFDTSLTDFEEPAFAEGLELADLCPNYLLDDDLEVFEVPTSSPQEQADRRRAVKCFEFLQAMEYRLRRYIHHKMVSAYGEGWERKRLGNDVAQRWEAKRDAAHKEGRHIELLIETADFTEYEAILLKRNHFRQLFADDFRDPFSI